MFSSLPELEVVLWRGMLVCVSVYSVLEPNEWCVVWLCVCVSVTCWLLGLR